MTILKYYKTNHENKHTSDLCNKTFKKEHYWTTPGL